jgi:autotransporter-associated beta strand protein
MKKNKRLLYFLYLLGASLATIAARAGTHTWTGASTNGLWTTSGNWQSSSVPALNESPLHLLFPSGATRKTITNNFNGLAVDTITFQGGAWNVFGSGANPALTFRDPLSISNIGVTAGSAVFHTTVPFVLAGDNAFSVAANTTLTLSNVMSGVGGFTKLGAGEILMNGVANNTYAGPTYVNGGTLTLRKTFVFGPYIAVPGPLYIGMYEFQPNPALRPTVQFLSNDQIATNASVSIYPSGRLLLQDHTQTIGPLTINSGELDTGTNGLLKLLAQVISTNITIGNTQLIGELKGCVDLGNVSHSIRVESLPLNIHARIIGQTNGALEKLGLQTLCLFGSNSYGGLTIVREGSLAVAHARALGTNGAPTVVSNGAALWLEGGISIDEPLVLNGFSAALATNIGALCSFGSNYCTGEITLASDAGILTPGSSDYLTIGNRLTGLGGWEKHGAGTVRVYGGVTAGNDYDGITRVHQGTLVLDKGSGGGEALAVPGTLEIGLPAGAGLATCELKREGELSATTAITLGAQGTLTVDDGYAIVGSIAGNGTIDISPTAKLLTGFNDTDSIFNGTLTGGEPAQPHFYKYGAGTLDLGGTNQFAGRLEVQEGALRINSTQSSAQIDVAGGAELGGTGTVSNIVVHSFGVVAPGSSLGKLHASSFTNDGQHSLHIDLNGPIAGTSHDQFELDVAPKLFRVSLAVNVGANFNPTNGQKFVVVKNNGGPLTDQFHDLDEGSLVSSESGHFFSVSYHGGDGNDVELTTLGGPVQIQGIHLSADAAVITATGIPGVTYWVEASTNLSVPNGWVTVDFIFADIDGSMIFEDFDSPSFPQRFYRFVLAD